MQLIELKKEFRTMSVTMKKQQIELQVFVNMLIMLVSKYSIIRQLNQCS